MRKDVFRIKCLGEGAYKKDFLDYAFVLIKFLLI